MAETENLAFTPRPKPTHQKACLASKFTSRKIARFSGKIPKSQVEPQNPKIFGKIQSSGSHVDYLINIIFNNT